MSNREYERRKWTQNGIQGGLALAIAALVTLLIMQSGIFMGLIAFGLACILCALAYYTLAIWVAEYEPDE